MVNKAKDRKFVNTIKNVNSVIDVEKCKAININKLAHLAQFTIHIN